MLKWNFDLSAAPKDRQILGLYENSEPKEIRSFKMASLKWIHAWGLWAGPCHTSKPVAWTEITTENLPDGYFHLTDEEYKAKLKAWAIPNRDDQDSVMLYPEVALLGSILPEGDDNATT